MKRGIGWVMLVIFGLNVVAILGRIAQDESVGSPIYLLLLIMIAGGGLSLIRSRRTSAKESNAIVKKEDEGLLPNPRSKT